MIAMDPTGRSLTLENFDDPRALHDTSFVLTSPRSLRACHRFGIKPVQLLPRSSTEFEAIYGQNKSAYDAFETNRKKMLCLVRAERKKYIHEASRECTTKNDIDSDNKDSLESCSDGFRLGHPVISRDTTNLLQPHTSNFNHDEVLQQIFSRLSVEKSTTGQNRSHIGVVDPNISSQVSTSGASSDSLDDTCNKKNKHKFQRRPQSDAHPDRSDYQNHKSPDSSTVSSQSFNHGHSWRRTGGDAATASDTSSTEAAPFDRVDLERTGCNTTRSSDIDALRTHLQHLSSSFLLHQREVDDTFEQHAHQAEQRRAHRRNVAKLRRECKRLEDGIKRKDATRRQNIAMLKTKLHGSGGPSCVGGSALDTCLARERLWLERRMRDTHDNDTGNAHTTRHHVRYALQDKDHLIARCEALNRSEQRRWTTMRRNEQRDAEDERQARRLATQSAHAVAKAERVKRRRLKGAAFATGARRRHRTHAHALGLSHVHRNESMRADRVAATVAVKTQRAAVVATRKAEWANVAAQVAVAASSERERARRAKLGSYAFCKLNQEAQQRQRLENMPSQARGVSMST